MTFSRLFTRAGHLSRAVGSRSMYTATKFDPFTPNWINVGLTFGATAFLWGLLFKQHSTDVHEYKKRNGLE